jgi:glutathione S-transferase
VICEYIDDTWPEIPLKPIDSWGRAQMRLWTKQLDEGVHAAVGALSFFASRFAISGLKNRAKIVPDG